MTAEMLRRAAALMREPYVGLEAPTDEGDFHLAVADWLDEEAGSWVRNFEAVQRPSRSVDEPPAICFGDPRAAEIAADWHARRAIAAARAYLGEPA